jgi:hypothetical protein
VSATLAPLRPGAAFNAGVVSADVDRVNETYPRRWLLPVLAALALSACTFHYEPWVHATEQPVSARWLALQEMARDEGWQVVAAQRSPVARMELIMNPTARDLRERLLVSLRRDETLVEITSELWSGERWLGTRSHCDEYTFARERILARQLDRAAGRPAGGQLGAGYSSP